MNVVPRLLFTTSEVNIYFQEYIIAKNVGNSVFQIELCMAPNWSAYVKYFFVSSCFFDCFKLSAL
jgi:hypothetical protein